MKNLISLFFFLFLPLSLFAQTPTSGERFRAFLAQIVEATDPSKSLELNGFDRVKLDEFLSGNPSFIQDVLDGKDLQGAYQSSDINEILQREIGSNNLNEFGEHLISSRDGKIQKAFMDNLDVCKLLMEGGKLEGILAEANLLETFHASGVPIENLEKQIKNQIYDWVDNYARTSMPLDRYQALKKVIDTLDLDNSKAAIRILDELEKLPPERRAALLSSKKAQMGYHSLVEAVDDALERMDISKSPEIERLKAAEFNIPDQNMKRLAETLTTEYLDADMPKQVKRRILEGVLNLHPAEHAAKLELVILKNTDILFQKSLQYLATLSTNPDFLALGTKLQSELTFLADADIQHILFKTYGERASKLRNIKQVAAATTGVGAIADLDGEKVFVKVQRPGLLESIERDKKRILSLVADSESASEIVRSITAGVVEEVDLPREAFNFEVGKAIYENPKKGLFVPGIVHEFEPSDKILVMEVAGGEPVSKIDIKSLPDEKLLKLGEAYESSIKTWFNRSMHLDNSSKEAQAALEEKIEGLYQKYFGKKPGKEALRDMTRMFHGDLHGGNIFFELDPKSPVGYRTTWIDWGNAHYLNRFQARGQVELLLGAISRDKDMIVGALNYIFPMSMDQKALLSSKVDNFLYEAKLEKMSFDKIVNRSIDLSLESGISLPEQVVNWSRGKGMLQLKVENELNGELLRRGGVKGVRKFRTDTIYVKSMANNIIRNAPKQLFSSAQRQSAIVRGAALIDFVKSNFRHLLKKYCTFDYYPRPRPAGKH